MRFSGAHHIFRLARELARGLELLHEEDGEQARRLNEGALRPILHARDPLGAWIVSAACGVGGAADAGVDVVDALDDRELAADAAYASRRDARFDTIQSFVDRDRLHAFFPTAPRNRGRANRNARGDPGA